ncbi:MAG: hypothetical protein ACXWO3_13800, partial [Isosphaeraceae bacterium]
MKEIAIHFEGGGDTAQQKVEPRTGLGCLLDAQKTAARAKGLGWKLVPSGGRQRAYDALINAMRRGDGTTLNVLPVDSEEALAPEPPPAETESREEKRQRERSNARVRRDHLAYRDGWDLSDVEPEQIHLMVPCMEAWIAADPDGMALYNIRAATTDSTPSIGSSASAVSNRKSSSPQPVFSTWWKSSIRGRRSYHACLRSNSASVCTGNEL